MAQAALTVQRGFICAWRSLQIKALAVSGGHPSGTPAECFGLLGAEFPRLDRRSVDFGTLSW